MDQLGWQEGDSKRVTWSPTPRLLRYYTTLGILDRAARFQGRIALYSGKHLLQVLAIKYLQLGGKKLEEIQQLLLGLTEEKLAELLGVSMPLPDPQQSQKAEVGVVRREDFWHELPTRPEAEQVTIHRSKAKPPKLSGIEPRKLSSIEPLPGLQVLIDKESLPDGFCLEEFLKQLPGLIQDCHQVQEDNSHPV